MKRLLFTITVLITSISYSQEWKTISLTSDFEKTSIRKHFGDKAWIKIENTELDISGKKGKGKILLLVKFDCNGGRIGVVSQTQYFHDDDTPASSEDMPETLVDMTYVIPDSKGEFWLIEYCKL